MDRAWDTFIIEPARYKGKKRRALCHTLIVINVFVLIALLTMFAACGAADRIPPGEGADATTVPPLHTEPLSSENLRVGSDSYVCTMCRIYSDTAGACSKCGGPLGETTDTHHR